MAIAPVVALSSTEVPLVGQPGVPVGPPAASPLPVTKPAKKPVKKVVKKAGARPVKKAAKKAGTSPTKKAVAPPGTRHPATGRGALPPGGVATGPRGPERRRVGSPPRRRLQAPWVVRVFADPNTDGPRSRVGFAWFLLLVPAAYFGPVATAALFAPIAGIAALQSAQAWRKAGYRPSRLIAFPAAIALPLLAIENDANPGILIVILPIVSLAAALVVPRRRRRTSAVGAAGLTVVCALAPGLAALGAVYCAQLGPAPAVVFVLLVSAYDLGSFLVGAEASRYWHGIIAGTCCTMVAMAPIFCFQLPPFDGEGAAWVFAGMMAALAPLGQILASLALPSADTWVPALRRLDAYILTGPLWAWTLWHYLA